MPKRVESPSSINTFKQCKRKYYYQYLEKLPTVSNIHQVRGNIAHSTLENFFDLDSSQLNEENYPAKLKETAQKLFLHHWKLKQAELDKLGLHQDLKIFYFEETMLMIMNWVNHLINDLDLLRQKKNCSIQQAFLELTPLREQEYRSDNYSVRGFIDAVKQIGNEVHIIDYKTNSSFDLKDENKLQLAIYSLLYFEKHGKLPSKVGIFFLRHKLKLITVDEQLMDLARTEIKLIHTHTSATEKKDDYPKTITSLCKWSTGQCDFYDVCKPHG
ncbi:MAG TPA: PD-(D/E)XK nuclease family protein [Candidatus Nanoarchaeia archaeon]|nr:PD-(D/E)XK nuclease family protein [Candidatus Nanoarchaeia archaeon]